MAGWNCTPLKAPLVPKTRLVLPLPENTRRIDFGFPPPSHAHLNPRVSTRNEELPRPQLYLDDFRNVLRKKHAGGRCHLAALSRPKIVNSDYRSIDYRSGRVKSRAAMFFRQSRPVLRQSAASLGEIQHRGLFLFIHQSLTIGVTLLATAIVIVRSGSDEAIQLWSNLWIASLRAQ